MKCTVFRVNVPYFYTSVPGKVDRMLAGLHQLCKKSGVQVSQKIEQLYLVFLSFLSQFD